MSYCQCRLKLVFASIFKQFGFKNVAILLDKSDLFSLTVGKNLEYGLKEAGLLKFVKELDGNELLFEGKLNKSENDRQMRELKTFLKDASMYARVLILSVRGQLVRKFMLAAYQLGMTKGEWVFLDVEIFQVSYVIHLKKF
jgi:atrial natriuretic peptide receptor A